jgi:hypothetical protein
MKDEKIKLELSELFCHLPLIFIFLICVFGLWSLIFNLLLLTQEKQHPASTTGKQT